jgi:hypothetical protein
LAQAEAALRDADFKTAKRLFEEAADLFEKENRDLEIAILDRKISLADQLLKLQEEGKWPLELPQGPSDLSTPIGDLDALKTAKWTPLGKQGSTSQVWQSGDFVIKKMNYKDTDALNQALEGEIVTADLARHLGLDVPAAGVLVKDGETYIVSRFVPGKDLSDSSLADAFRYRDRLGQQNVLSLLLGDYDRHSDNFRIGTDGRVYSLDAANSDVRGTVWGNLENRPELVQMLSDTWLTNHTFNATSGRTNDANPDALIHDLLLSNSPAVQQTTKDVQGLVKDEAKLRELLEGSYRHVYGDKYDVSYVDQALAAIKSRAKTLDAITQSWNRRNLGK